MNFQVKDKLKKPSRFHDFETGYIIILDVKEPTTYEEAMKLSFSIKWHQAIDAEMLFLKMILGTLLMNQSILI